MHTTHQHHKFIMIGTCIADDQPVVLCKIDQFDIKDYHLLKLKMMSMTTIMMMKMILLMMMIVTTMASSVC